MTAISATGSRSLRIGERAYPVVLPNLGDSRLQLASVVISIHVLGQVGLGFHVSIAQILLAIVSCAVVELAITFRRSRAIVWPASAMLTGSSVALILRETGTRHGDWWSLRGWYLFVGIAVGSLLTKYLIRYRGVHIFNPSNIGLVIAFLLLGSDVIEPLDFWWGPLETWLVAAYVIILVGGVLLTSRIRMLGMAAGFWVAFAASLGVLAASGHCMTARWSFEPVCDWSFWRIVAFSPEVFVFLFFMITDPKTTPSGQIARMVFGAAVGVLAAVMLAPQQTEFGAKVALLGGLVVLCALRPFVERLFPAPSSGEDSAAAWLRSTWRARRRLALAGAGVVSAALVLFGLPARLPPPGAVVAAAAERPGVEVDAGSLPFVAVDSQVNRLDPAMTEARARLLARDLVADLEIEARALRTADGELAASSSHGARLEDVRSRIDEAAREGEVVVPTYSFEKMKLVVTFPGGAQSGARYGIEASGSVRRSRFPLGGDEDEGTALGGPESFASTFVLVESDAGYYLIADELGANA